MRLVAVNKDIASQKYTCLGEGLRLANNDIRKIREERDVCKEQLRGKAGIRGDGAK